MLQFSLLWKKFFETNVLHLLLISIGKDLLLYMIRKLQSLKASLLHRIQGTNAVMKDIIHV